MSESIRASLCSASRSSGRTPLNPPAGPSSRESQPSGVLSGWRWSHASTHLRATQLTTVRVLYSGVRVTGSVMGVPRVGCAARACLKCDLMAFRSYVCPDSTTSAGSRNRTRVMGHISSSGSASSSSSSSSTATGTTAGRSESSAFPRRRLEDDILVGARLDLLDSAGIWGALSKAQMPRAALVV